MDLGLRGRVGIVAAARGLAAEGARVTMLARNESGLRRAAEQIQQDVRPGRGASSPNLRLRS